MPTKTGLPVSSLPFLTLPDPAVAGEGALDPLGLATTGERLADWILPGLTARMSRPRFLTAIAVSAAVREGLEDAIPADGVTPSYLVFEWLAVEGFARAAERPDVARTPGIDEARTCVQAGVPMCARAYLKAPTVFGFHGVYRRLARHVGIIDQNDILGDNGYELLRIWEQEQGLAGFLDSSNASPGAGKERGLLRAAVTDGLKAGYTTRSKSWQGWQVFARHLVPTGGGPREAQFLRSSLLEGKAETRAAVFQLVEEPENLAFTEGNTEADLVRRLLPQAPPLLAARLRAILAYEEFCFSLESGFDWLRWLCSCAGARAVPRSEFAAQLEARRCAESLKAQIQAAQQCIDEAPPNLRSEFDELAGYFDTVTDVEGFYEALLDRHCEVQKAKPPGGKRSWFEQADNAGVFVRPPYRLEEPPAARNWWARPYRLGAVASFCQDLKREGV
jgi:hypothetical protein